MRASTILIVEDESVVALDLQLRLQAWGYQVVGTADTADQAVALASQFHPDLTLMDVMLRGDADGIHAAGRLHRELGTPVLFLTSFSDADTVQRAARTAAYGYVTKPYQPRELRAGIEVALWKSRLELQLRESERWFASTLHCVQDGVVTVDASGHVRLINPAAERLLSVSNEQVTGLSVDEVVRFDDPIPASFAMQVLFDRRVMGVRHGRLLTRAHGPSRPVDESAGPILDSRGGLLGVVLVLRDVSERFHHETLLRESEARFRHAFEFAPLGMALVALDGHFVQVNDALCRLLGRDAAQLLSSRQAMLTFAADQAHEFDRLEELRCGRVRVTQFEKRYLMPSEREPVWVLINASLLADAGQSTCYLYQVHDLSPQKEAAARLAELAGERIQHGVDELAQRGREELLARVSHEMRRPLNAALGFAELMKAGAAHKHGHRDAALTSPEAEPVLQAGQHLRARVDDVLDLQRAHEGELRFYLAPHDLQKLLPAAIELLSPLAELRGVRLRHELAKGLRVRVDEARLRQIVLNIGANAVKYNVVGGEVRFRAEAAAGERVRITVEDTGIGMSPQQLQHLFEPGPRPAADFLRVADVGLGLNITKKLVEQMGGRLSVSSRPGQGTLVAIEFAFARLDSAAP